MKKYFLLILAGLLWQRVTLAFCPVCAVAAGAGVGIARELGVDDSIVGLWLGGLTIALIAWSIDWCKKKNWKFWMMEVIIGIVFYSMTIVPLYFMGIIARPMRFFSPLMIDKLTMGIITGSFIFWFGGELYQELKKRNHGKAHFPFEKVAMPIGGLVLASLIYYFLIK